MQFGEELLSLQRLQATDEAIQTVKPALVAFTNSLSDEQKARFNEIGAQLGQPKRTAKPRPAAKHARTHSPYVLNVPRAKKPAAHRHVRVATAVQEAKESPGAAPVIWLNRTLPDPTPPSRRLATRFAHRLRSVSRANHVSWALVLGVLRAQGRSGAVQGRPKLPRRIDMRKESTGQLNRCRRTEPGGLAVRWRCGCAA